MDSTTEELLLQKLEEVILDEEEITTVLSASQYLNIPVQDASKILQTFVSNQKTTSTNITATYIVSGVLKDGSLGVKLVKEEELPEKRELFKTISSEVLYSVQKSNIVDIYSVASVNGFDASSPQEVPFPGTLTSKNCVIRSIKPKTIPKPETKPVIKGKSSFFIKSASAGNAEKKREDTERKKTESHGQSKSSVFPKAASTGSIDKDKTKEDSKNATKTTSKPKTNGSLASFFNKMSVKPVSGKEFNQKTTLESHTEKLITEDPKEAGSEEIIEEALNIDVDNDVPIQNSKSEESPPPKKTNKTKRQRSTNKKSDKPSKRRKRIKDVSDSDDDMFADNTQEKIEEAINLSDDEMPVVKHKIESPPPVKNKRRKLIDKTYEDEEGFIITSKEWVYESASEDEKEQKDPAESAALPKAMAETAPILKEKQEFAQSAASNNKGKKGKKNGSANQPTLMNFFKKA